MVAHDIYKFNLRRQARNRRFLTRSEGTPFIVGVRYILSKLACPALMVLVFSTAPRAQAETYLDAETLSVDGSGREVFTGAPLDPCCLYRVAISGTMQVGSWLADARYWADEAGNFSHSYGSAALVSFALDSSPGERISLEPIEEERALHRYVFLMPGKGERVSARFDWGGHSGSNADAGTGRLTVSISDTAVLAAVAQPTPTPQESPSEQIAGDSPSSIEGVWGLLALVAICVVVPLVLSLSAADKAAERGRLAVQQKLAEEQHQVEEEQHRVEEALRQRLATLRLELEGFPHYEDPKFVEDHARKYSDKLLSDRKEILADYVRRQRDVALLGLVEREAPHILRRMNWRMAALACAEKFDVEAPRPRKTVDEVRAAIARRVRVKGADAIAKAKERLDLTLEAEKMLDEYGLDEDERQRLSVELRDLILKDDTDQQGTIVGQTPRA